MALVALSTNGLLKPRRIEGHTSNVENPIMYSQLGPIVTASVTAGDSFVIPHKLTNVYHVTITGTNAAGGIAVAGDSSDTTDGAYVALTAAIPWEVLGGASAIGATTVTLGASSSEVADVYNGCTLDIRLTSGNVQTFTITDYAATTNVATLNAALTEAVTTANYYRVRGSVVTTPAAATTPSFSVEVIGNFEGN